jgi:hypothetical protein
MHNSLFHGGVDFALERELLLKITLEPTTWWFKPDHSNVITSSSPDYAISSFTNGFDWSILGGAVEKAAANLRGRTLVHMKGP